MEKSQKKNSSLTYLCEYFSKAAELFRALQACRPSEEQVRQAFSQLDSGRKGYLDISDICHLVGDISEQDLFYLFRTLDLAKEGAIQLQHLLEVTCPSVQHPSQQHKHFRYTPSYSTYYSNSTSSLRALQHFCRQMLNNLIFLQNQKQKIGFTEDILRLLYKLLCNTLKDNPFQAYQFTALLQHIATGKGAALPTNIAQTVHQIFRGSNLITQENFLESLRMTEDLHTESKKQKHKEKKKLSGGQRDYRNYTKEKSALDNSMKYCWNGFEEWRKRQPLFQLETGYQNGYQLNQEEKADGREKAGRLNLRVEEALNQIQNRRRELRKATLERKHMMDTFLDRKQGLSHSSTPSHRPLSPQSTSKAFQPHCETPSFKANFADEPEYQMSQAHNSLTDAKINYYSPNQTANQSLTKSLSQSNFHNRNLWDHTNNNLSAYVTKLESKVKQKELNLGKHASYNWLENHKRGTLKKENILKKAEQEAGKKIQEIERKAKEKAMERRWSAARQGPWSVVQGASNPLLGAANRSNVGMYGTLRYPW